MTYRPPPGPGGYGPPPGGYGPPGGGGYGPPPAGSYGINPYAAPSFDAPRVTYSQKSLATALVLAYLFGVFGVDRFYRGHVGLGILKLISCGGLGIWAMVDLVLLALGEAKDSDGRLLQPAANVVGTPAVNGNHVLLAGVLAGSLGVDRFMLGHTGLGVLKLLTCGGLGIWQLVDVILIASGNVRDAQGNSLRWR